MAADLSPPGEIVVFWIIRDSVCVACGEELGTGRFLRTPIDDTTQDDVTS